MPPYRPRLPEIVAMLDAMPANVDTLTEVSGRPAAWAQRMLSRMVCDRIINQRHGIYSRVAEIEPSYTLQIVEALRAGPMTRKQVEALGVGAKSACGILTTLERRGLIMVDSSRRPFRYCLPSPVLSSGLEALADFDARR
jgi:DNA-binding IclR family transcriptional regulator